MKSRILSLILVIAIVLSFGNGILPVVNAENALPSYNAKSEFGSELFGYYTRDITNGVNTQMTYNEGSKLYMVGTTANYIGSDYFSVGANAAIGSMLVFTAPYSGTITISNGREEGLLNRGKLGQRTEYAACYANIYGTDWSTLASYSIPAGPDPVATPDITNIQVTEGQQIRFLLGSNTPMNSYVIWIPEITYTAMRHDHVWSEEWFSNETHHWHECTIDDCDITDNAVKDGYDTHSDSDKDGACDSCGAEVLLCFNAKNEFGTAPFNYYTRDITTGVNTQMTYNEGSKLYMVGTTANYIGSDYFSVGANAAIGSMLVFTAPYSGTITISNARAEGLLNRGKLGQRTEYAACYATIYGTNWSTLASYSIPAGPDPVATPDIANIEVTEGQQIRFLLGSNTPMNSYVIWIPEITYTRVLHDHIWSEEWSSDDTHHWHECILGDCDITDNAVKDGYAIHVDLDKNGACDSCSAEVLTVSYYADSDYGTEVFGYYTRNISDGINTNMTFNTSYNMYIVGETANYIAPSYFSVGANPAIGSMLVFTAPHSGIITISNAVEEGIINKGRTGDRTNYAACYATIYSPSWSVWASYSIPASADPVATPDIENIEVTAGQQIRFLVGSNDAMNSYINWIPVITYTIIGHQHTWGDTWQYNATHHWRDCSSSCKITENSDKRGYGVHIDDNGDLKCDICSGASENVVFEAREAVTYYISSSVGNDANDGLSANTPWKSVDKLSKIRLYAGDTVLFKSGDIWYGSWELDLSRGTKRNPIVFSSYGEGNKPDFRYYSGTVEQGATGICLKLLNANGFVMDGLSVGYANLGIKLEYDVSYFESDYVRFTNCHFHDIYGVTQLDNLADIYFSAGITTDFQGSHSGDDEGNGWPLRGMYIDNCTTNDAGALVAGPRGVYGFYMTDCVAENNGYYGTTVYGCQNGYIDGCIFRNNGTREMPAGSCGIMIAATDFVVRNSIIEGQQRQGDDPDGCGIDFEANCRNVTIENCLFRENAGVGVFYFTSGRLQNGTNYNTNVTNCYFINNNQNEGNIRDYDVYVSNYAASGCIVSGNQYYYSWLFGGSGTKGFAYKASNNDLTLSNNTRIYSIPADLDNLILQGGQASEVNQWNVSLGDDLNLNFYLNISDYCVDSTAINVTVLDQQVSYNAAQLSKNEKGQYVLTVELAAAQMTENVTIQIVRNGNEVSTKNYSIRSYADYILDDANGYSDQDKLMVQAMLHYGASAQEYFDINPDNLANDGYTDSVTEKIPAAADYSTLVSGSISGIRFYGATLLFRDRIAVRFYFTVTGDGSYTVNGKTLTEKDGLWYVEFADIAPQDLDQIIEAVVSDENGSNYTVVYSPLYYIVRQYNKTENAELKDLVQNLYDYHKAAVAYVGEK